MKKIKQARGKRRTLVVNWVTENNFQVEVRTEDFEAEGSNIIVLPLPNSGLRSSMRPPPPLVA